MTIQPTTSTGYDMDNDDEQRGDQLTDLLVRELVRPLIDRHPLPWRIDHDWTVEVVDANGECVTKLVSRDMAERFIAIAIEVSVRNAEIKVDVEALMLVNESDVPA